MTSYLKSQEISKVKSISSAVRKVLKNKNSNLTGNISKYEKELRSVFEQIQSFHNFSRAKNEKFINDLVNIGHGKVLKDILSQI